MTKGSLRARVILRGGDDMDLTKFAEGADVKIMDRFFRHLELPDSENFSKPGFQLKAA